MASTSLRPAPASKPFKAPTLTLEAAAFVTLLLGLVYLFARNCHVRSPQPRRNERLDNGIEDRFHTHRITEFLIS